MKLKKQSFFSKLWDENLYCFLAAIIAAIIMIFVYLCYNFFPVGDNIILRMDLYHQYAPLFAELYDRVFGGQSLIYSFTSGLGSGFLGNYFNYLASPALLFVLIFGHLNVPEAVAAMILTKASVSAFTFSYFAKKVFKENSLIATAFGIMYAFSGWFVAYYWNVMWLDAVCIFPLVMLGIYRIITKCKPLTFTLSLAFTLITNYYMGYMVCILSVIMFLYFYFSNYETGDKLNPDIILKKQYSHSLLPKFYNNRFLKSGTTFALAGITAGALSAFALVPVFFILQNSSATSSTFPTDYQSYFNIFDFIANHLSGLTTTIRSSGDDVLPNIYCGILTVILIVPYYFTSHIKLREKIATTVTLAFFYFSFNINYLNYIWHGFHFPNDLPYRFSFAYSFFLLLIAFRVITDIDKVSLKTILASSFGVVGFTILVEELGSKNAEELTIWSSIAFAVIYAVVLALLKDKKYVKSYISILLLCTVCTEVLIADTPNYVISQDKTNYVSGYEQVKECINKIDEKEGKNTFYRTELASLVKRMDNCWYGYNGSSTFTSMAYEKLSHLELKLGLSGNDINSYTYHSQTPVYNSLFGIKYLIDNTKYTNTDNYVVNFSDTYFEKQENVDDAVIYKYKYALPLCYGSKNDIKEWNCENPNPFTVQNDMFKGVTGTDNVFTPVKFSIESSTNFATLSDSTVNSNVFTLTKSNKSESAELMLKTNQKENELVYLYFKSDDVDDFYVTYNDNLFTADIDEPFIIDCGKAGKDSDIYITIGLDSEKSSATVTGYAYTLNEDNFRKGVENINKNGVINIEKFEESYISGTINVGKDCVILTTIPYDKSWSVKIDGKTVPEDKIFAAGNALTCIETEPGEHSIEFKYSPKGLFAGISISFIALIILILIYVCKNRKMLVFSEKFRTDNVMLGKWRDFAAENEQSVSAELDLIETEEPDSDETKDNALLNENEKMTWEEVLSEAEEYSQKQLEQRKKEQEQLEAIQSIERNMSFETISGNGNNNEDTIESKFDDIPESEIPETKQENGTDIESYFVQDENETVTDKKKTVNKKLIATVCAVAVAIIIAVAMFGLKGNKNPDEYSTNEETSETAETKIKTSKTETTQTTETTTQSTVPTETTQTTAVSTTQTTTAAPETTTAVTTAPSGNYRQYVVEAGDYPFSILRKAGLEPNAKLQEFYDINGGKTVFNVGDTVLLPDE